MTTPSVFISYSHKDEIWKDRLRPHLKMLEQTGRLTIWDDLNIDAGATWYDEIKKAMEDAEVAICLISADYLASDFCIKEEIPYLLERRKADGMTIIPVLIRPCAWMAIDWLKETPMLPRDGKAIARDFKDDWDTAFTQVTKQILSINENRVRELLAPPKPRWLLPEKVDVDRLPITGSELFGRQNELKLLDEAWDFGKINVISLVAWGGVGKSTLVNRWRQTLAADNYRGARHVFTWSFYSQGTGERVTSADIFIVEALKWFGDPNPWLGSPLDKGQRLADLVRKEKTLLLLDGMEPLQSYIEFERGKIKDPALAVLVTELAKENPGLCVITTRESIVDLADFPNTTQQIDLEQISSEAGRTLLRVGGVQGTDAELEQTARDFGLHALALNLLAAYIHEIPGHHISNASGIPDLEVPLNEGKHLRSIISAFEKLFGDSAEVNLLRILGLFSSPVNKEEIAVVRVAPSISNLTEHIQKLSETEWLQLIRKLRRLKLLAPESRHLPDSLDTHPLIREHFGKQLKQEYPYAWQEGNERLYEYYKSTAKEFPDTWEEMAPLFAAVEHGCKSGRYQETLIDIYWQRILRGNESFSWRRLGSTSYDLGVLSNFFDQPWQKPVNDLTPTWKSWVLNQAGFHLRSLGRLSEALQPMQAGLEADIARGDLKNTAIAAHNLSQLQLTMGNLNASLETARQSIELAENVGEVFRSSSFYTALANALHQTGLLNQASSAFQEAELIQKKRQPSNMMLQSLQGYQYCDLLLDQGEYQEVFSRATQTLEMARRNNGFLDIALCYLSLGRVSLLTSLANKGNLDEAIYLFEQSLTELRRAGVQDYLSLGLLARATTYRVTRVLDKSQKDLDEAFTIATRGGMGLHLADCHLEYARLYLAKGEKSKAREHWQIAKDSIEKMGYHRRDKEVQELEEQLK